MEKILTNQPNEEVLKIIIPALTLLIFAETLPQAVCNSKLGFNLASGLWFISVLIFIITSPIAYPMSLFLARYLKRSVREVLTPEEKMCMIRNMAKNANANEKTIMVNATTFSFKKVEELMVPLQDVFLLSRSQRLNRSTILTLVEKGYTRVPVCHEKNGDAIVGILNVKDLILVASDLHEEPTVREVLEKIESLKDPEQRKKFIAKYVSTEMSAQLLLGQMKQGDFHIACVVKYIRNEPKVVGIVTIEDILEQVVGDIDSSNDTKVRSSVDDRGDNTVIGWCREAGTDKNYPLSFTKQLRVLQELLKQCTVLQKLEVEIMKAKQLLSLDRIRTAKQDQILPTDNLFLVVWKGTIQITKNKNKEKKNVTVTQEKQKPDHEGDKLLAAYVLGKQLLNDLVTSVGYNLEEESEEDVEVKVVSEEVAYFKLRMVDLNRTLFGIDMTRRGSKTPVLTPTPASSSSGIKSLETADSFTEITPLLRRS